MQHLSNLTAGATPTALAHPHNSRTLAPVLPTNLRYYMTTPLDPRTAKLKHLFAMVLPLHKGPLIAAEGAGDLEVNPNHSTRLAWNMMLGSKKKFPATRLQLLWLYYPLSAVA